MAALDTLPSEIQQQVFDYLYNRILDVRECIRVCSMWKRLFQKVLYTSVKLYSFSQLSKLSNTLEENKNLGNLITEITFYFEVYHEDDDTYSTVANLFTHLHNLKRIDCSHGIHFKFLLEALLENKLPHLDYVKSPYYDEEHLQHYTACATILKDRLINLSIRDPAAEEEEESDDEESVARIIEGSALFHQLFNVLGEFKKVEYLHIKKKSDNKIDLIEKVTKNCTLLERLDFDLIPTRNEIENNSTNITSLNIPDYLPAPNINHLTFHKSVLDDFQLTEYIMHKFPRLKTLDIYGQTNPSSYLSEFRFQKILNYLSNIKYVNIQNIPYKEDTLINSIGSFWEDMSKSRSLSVEFRYNSSYTIMDELAIRIDDSICSNIIRYARSKNDLDYAGIIAKYGHQMDSLAVYKAPPSSRRTTLYESLILQPLKYCIKLKKLSILGSSLTGTNVPDYGLDRKHVFDSLSFIACTIENNVVFERLSELFAYINYMDLYAIKYANRIKNTPTMDIIMTKTAIGTLLFSTKALFSNNRRNHKLIVKLITPKSYYAYYMYDIVAMEEPVFKQIDDQESNYICDHDKYFMICLTFKSIRCLIISHFERELKLPIAEVK